MQFELYCQAVPMLAQTSTQCLSMQLNSKTTLSPVTLCRRACHGTTTRVQKARLQQANLNPSTQLTMGIWLICICCCTTCCCWSCCCWAPSCAWRCCLDLSGWPCLAMDAFSACRMAAAIKCLGGTCTQCCAVPQGKPSELRSTAEACYSRQTALTNRGMPQRTDCTGPVRHISALCDSWWRTPSQLLSEELTSRYLWR